MLRLLYKYDSEAPVLSWTVPYQEMPSEIRAVTDANWAEELEAALYVVLADVLWWPSTRGAPVYAADSGAVDKRE